MASVVCVLHHHIGQESVFERGLNVVSTRVAFEAQIERLALDYDIIDLETLLSGPLPRRPLLLTFDDAFRSVLDVAKEVLAPRGLPSVFFINPGLIGNGNVSLDGALAWAADKVGLKALCETIGVPLRESVGELVVQEMASYGPRERADIKARVLATFGPPDFSDRAPLLEEEDLPELCNLGVEIGNHTMTHVHCRALKENEFKDEVVAAKEKLESVSGTRVRAFSVPYGHEKDLKPEMLNVLRASGHEAIFLVHARSNMLRPAPDIWYRSSLHNETPKQLSKMLRYTPVLRSIKHRLLG